MFAAFTMVDMLRLSHIPNIDKCWPNSQFLSFFLYLFAPWLCDFIFYHSLSKLLISQLFLCGCFIFMKWLVLVKIRTELNVTKQMCLLPYWFNFLKLKIFLRGNKSDKILPLSVHITGIPVCTLNVYTVYSM